MKIVKASKKFLFKGEETMKEIHIAICDDKLEVCIMLQKIIQEILEREKKNWEIIYFQSGKLLCEKLKETQYDLLFLDIELDGKNGVEIGRYIRNTLHNEKTEIVFISGYPEYAMELFDLRPLNFLVKPFDEKEIEWVLNKYINVMEQNMRLFTYQKEGKIYQIPLMNIMYFEKDKRKITITTTKEKDSFYGFMEEIYEQLKSHRFLFIHKSVIVNFSYVSRLEYAKVCMMNQKIFSISQSKRKEIHNQVLEYR